MKKTIITAIILMLISVLIFSGSAEKHKAGKFKKEGGKSIMKVTSSAFENEKRIPEIYTCKGRDISPGISWEGVSETAKSLVLICDDPDAPAGTWVHWVLYNIPAGLKGLPENASDEFYEDNGILSGRNSWGKTGYGGPCPPSGVHRYYFKLYAIDKKLDFKDTTPAKEDILEAIKAHIVDEAGIMGTFGK
ncbi:MAG: YbhB/YbcL family Raf kinase inhibitor-like protein [Candidatus Goldiibacteriota bacterium]